VWKKPRGPYVKSMSPIRKPRVFPVERKDILAIVPSLEKKPYLAHLGSSGDTQLLSKHLLQVSVISARLGAKIGMARAGELIGLIHDLGKYSQAFQHYLREMSHNAEMEMEPDLSARGSVDHSTAGAQLVWNHLIHSGASQSRHAAEFLSLCIASHHSGLIDCVKPDGSDDLSRRLNKADDRTHRTEAWNNAEAVVRKRIETLLTDPELIVELIDACRRIRMTDDDNVIQPLKRGLLARMLFSCLIDADRIDSADFEKPVAASFRQHNNYTPWSDLIARLENHLAQFSSEGSVNGLRRQVSMHCLEAAGRPRGIYTLTVPTGGGKTLASLRFALHHAQAQSKPMERVIYVSPYISIVDQNAEIVRKVLEPEGCDFASIVLEHHSNLTGEKESWRGGVLAENWDAPVVFTTAVQVLEALFGGGTRAVRRMHALANAVIVFDEVQTLPIRTIHLFNNAVNFLVEQCGSSVVLCTATQPLLHKVNEAKGAARLAPAAELMPDPPALFRALKRFETFDQTKKAGGWQSVDVAELAVAETLDEGSCLVGVNTKRDALAIYSACKVRLDELHENLEPGCLVHLSTHMCPAHRLDALTAMKAALKEKRRVLCVSTQLIEAGVDIDFAAVVRDLAGLDSIAQAAGRCNRNGERLSGRVHIVKLATQLPKQLEEIASAQNTTLRILDEWKDATGDVPFDLSDPEQMSLFFQYHFFARKDLMGYPVKLERKDTLLNMLGKNGMAVDDGPKPHTRPGGFMQSFRSAADEFRPIDSVTQGVVVPFGKAGEEIINLLCSTRDLDGQFRLLRRAQQFTVNLFPHEILSLQQKGAIKETQPGTGVLCLQPGFYSGEFGLDLEGQGRMETLNV
jgi:CRISPR-associated endonuclease/helicase Cas3